MNEDALYHVTLFLDAYSDLIKGVFAVKGMGHKKNSIVYKMNIDGEPKNYSDRLRLLFMNLSASMRKIGQTNLDKIIFELDDYYLILKRKFKTKGGAPLFLSLLTTKTEDIEIFDTICETLSQELYLLLR